MSIFRITKNIFMNIHSDIRPTRSTYSTSFFSLVIFLASSLLVIWPLPGTIAIRQILLALLFMTLIFIQKNSLSNIWNVIPKKIALLFLLLTGWLIFHSIFIADDKAFAVRNLSSQWLRATISVLTGILLGYYAIHQKWHFRHTIRADTLLFCILASTFVIHLGSTVVEAIIELITNAQIQKRIIYGINGGPEQVSYLANFALCIAMATYVLLATTKKCLANKKQIILALTVITILISLNLYLSAMRNAFICATVIFLASMVFIFIKASLSQRTKLTVSIIATFAMLTLMYIQSQDPRWTTFAETLPISWDTKGNQAWLNKKLPLPKLSDGTTVSHSNYTRVAWFKEGSLLIAENPLGKGYDRNIFGKALSEKYLIDEQDISSIHSHSGLIDFTIAAGLPGGILLYSFFVMIIFYGFRMSVKHPQLAFFGVALALIVLNFTTRSIIDSVIRDHMFEMFMFLTGFFVICSACFEEKIRSSIVT